MIGWLLLVGIAVATYGTITESISLGVIFIISLAVFLYSLFSLINKGARLTEYGKLLMVISSLLLAYSICNLFLGIDVKAVLGL